MCIADHSCLNNTYIMTANEQMAQTNTTSTWRSHTRISTHVLTPPHPTRGFNTYTHTCMHTHTTRVWVTRVISNLCHTNICTYIFENEKSNNQKTKQAMAETARKKKGGSEKKQRQIPYATATFANCLSLEDGSRDVVTMTLGSSTMAHLYSSSSLVVRPAGG